MKISELEIFKKGQKYIPFEKLSKLLKFCGLKQKEFGQIISMSEPQICKYKRKGIFPLSYVCLFLVHFIFIHREESRQKELVLFKILFGRAKS